MALQSFHHHRRSGFQIMTNSQKTIWSFGMDPEKGWICG
jgi:hypothetical protein